MKTERFRRASCHLCGKRRICYRVEWKYYAKPRFGVSDKLVHSEIVCNSCLTARIKAETKLPHKSTELCQ